MTLIFGNNINYCFFVAIMLTNRNYAQDMVVMMRETKIGKILDKKQANKINTDYVRRDGHQPTNKQKCEGRIWDQVNMKQLQLTARVLKYESPCRTCFTVILFFANFCVHSIHNNL